MKRGRQCIDKRRYDAEQFVESKHLKDAAHSSVFEHPDREPSLQLEMRCYQDCERRGVEIRTTTKGTIRRGGRRFVACCNAWSEARPVESALRSRPNRTRTFALGVQIVI